MARSTKTCGATPQKKRGRPRNTQGTETPAKSDSLTKLRKDFAPPGKNVEDALELLETDELIREADQEFEKAREERERNDSQGVLIFSLELQEERARKNVLQRPLSNYYVKAN